MKWKKGDRKQRICEAMGLEIDDPITIKTAAGEFKAQNKDPKDRANVMYGINLLTRNKFDVNRRLDTLTRGDLINADPNSQNSIQRLVRYVATGVTQPAAVNGGSAGAGNNGNGHRSGVPIGRLTFGKAKTAEILKLIPVGGTSGRFAEIKFEVQRMVNSLSKDESGTIQAPKRAMDEKEAKSISMSVNMMLSRAPGDMKQWRMLWNPVHSVFLVVRRTDLAKVKAGGN